MRLILTIFLAIVLNTSFADSKIASVIIAKGEVKALTIDKKIIVLKKGMWLDEGMQVRTSAKSFAKILFKDKSTMSVAPKSTVQIVQFKDKKPGILNLLKGKIKSQVTKNYMNIKKDKSKLYITTKTAAMGVRGTEFQVSYNTSKKHTNLVTFSGAVAFAKLEGISGGINQIRNGNTLEKMLNSKNAVVVKKGQESNVSKNSKGVTRPVTVPTAKLEKLKNEITVKSIKERKPSSVANKIKKKYRNPVPPGVNATEFGGEVLLPEGEIIFERAPASDIVINQDVPLNTTDLIPQCPPFCPIEEVKIELPPIINDNATGVKIHFNVQD